MPKLNAKRLKHISLGGFTLIELLVVISIIAILLAVATVSFTNAQEKGRDNKRKSDLKAVQQALELYFSQHGKYPTDGGAGGEITCNITGDTSAQPWNTEFDCDENGAAAPAKITFMNPLPKDPVFAAGSNQNYYYDQTSNTTYVLSARLENLQDRDFKGHPTTNTTCTPQGYTNATTYQRNYCVVNP